MSDCFVVLANKTWYEGYIPLYVHFARLASPQAHVLVYLLGRMEEETRTALRNLDVPADAYTVIEDHKPGYGQTPVAAKIARFTVDDEHIRAFDHAYTGDIDMLVVPEKVDLFDQHRAHAAKLLIPISNMARRGAERLTGLHFVVCAPYFEAVGDELARLDRKLIQAVADDQVAMVFPKGCEDEEGLYHAIGTARPDWLAALQTAHFRPHHGTHMGHFRSLDRNRFARLGRPRLRSATRYYHDFVYDAFRNGPVLRQVQPVLARFRTLDRVIGNFMTFKAQDDAPPPVPPPQG